MRILLASFADPYDWQQFGECSADCGGGERQRLSGPGCHEGEAPACPSLGVKYRQVIKCHSQSCTKGKHLSVTKFISSN